MNSEKEKQINRAMRQLLQKEPRFNLNEIRVIVAIERAIARLSALSELAGHLVFKGGFVLFKSYGSLRFTRDADALAVSISKEHLSALVQRALASDLDDGLWYGDIQIRELADQGEYGACRFDCAFQIGVPDLKKIHKLSRIHVDVGFSDILPDKPAGEMMPSLLPHEEPVSWKIYPIEYIVAEKLQTLLDRGSANSRAKDIYDLIHLLPQCQDQAALASAIRKTFQNRKTAIADSLVERVCEFDRTILAAGWPGVKILKDKTDFEAAWQELMDCLENLDRSMRHA